MNSKKEKLLNDTYQKWMQIGLYDLPLDGANNFVDPEIMGYGTAIDEKVLSISDYRDLINRQREQAAGLEMNFETTPVFRSISNKEDSAFFVDEIKVSIILKEGNQELFLRMTTIMEYVDSKWIVVHWHGSMPTETLAETDTWLVNEWKRKNEKLQILVDEKTFELLNKNRELEIETALEKVRTIAMGMKKPADMVEVCKAISEQLEHLGIKDIRNVQTAIINEGKGTYLNYQYFAAYDQGVIEETKYNKHPRVFEMVQEMKKSADAFFSGSFDGEELKIFREYRKLDNQFHDPILDEVPHIQYNFYSIGLGGLGLTTYKNLPPEGLDIFRRFHKVFSLAYKRFIDIEKAEAQTRETEIQLALERVRARSLAMHHTSELQDVVNILAQQLHQIGLDINGGVFITINDEVDETIPLWASAGAADYVQKAVAPFLNKPIFTHLRDAIKRGNNFFTEAYSKEEKDEMFRHLFNYDPWKATSTDRKTELLSREGGLTRSAIISNHTSIAITNHYGKKFSDEDHDILKRFGNVFEQSYIRFLDLQKAEAQAREAQIELSLERIRSQVTAMRESSELLDIVVTMRSEYIALGHEAHYFWHMRWLPEKYEKAMTSGDGTRIGMIMELPRGFHKDQRMLDWEKTKEPIGIFTYDADGAIDYVDKMIQTGRFDLVDHNAPGPDDIRAIGGITFVMARTTHGEIGYSLPGVVPNPPAEDLSTLVRFAGVFDLAYKRFEDLKKAERQKREAEIELALERTRNQSMLMQHSDELNEISKTFHEQLLLLGIDSEFSFVWLPDEEKNEHMFWATWVSEVDKLPNYHSRAIKYPLDKSEPGTAACYLAWESGESVHETYVPAGDIVAFFATWEELLRGAEQFKPELFPEGIYYTEAYMKYGCFGIDIRRQLSADEKEIIRRFAVEFERTYTRFLDLQKVEAQNMMIQADNDRKTKELEDARQLQLSMLPKELPKLPHLDIAVYMKTATEVGGDYYDFNVDDNGTLTVLVGDATGHGMMSGMMVSIMKSFFISNRSSIDLKQLFENSNNSLKEMQLGRLMMPLIGVQFNSEKLIATNAGMPSLLYFRNKSQKAGEFVSNNLPLGGMKGTQYLLKEIRYEKGDTLLLMSDGFAELRNENQQQYGYTRIKEQFGSIVHKSAAEIIEELKSSAAQWLNGSEPDDDVTFVVIKVK